VADTDDLPGWERDLLQRQAAEQAAAERIEDLIARAAPVAVRLPGQVSDWTGKLVAYSAGPAVMIETADGSRVLLAAGGAVITERDIHRLAAPSTDDLHAAITECAATIAGAAPGRPVDETAADMAEAWLLFNALMSTGVPLPTPWAASTGDPADDGDPPTEILHLPEEGTP
jgi:hypothetical protein